MNATAASTLQLLANRYSYFLRRERNFTYWSLVGPVCRLNHVIEIRHLEQAVSWLLERHAGLCLQGGFFDGAWREWLLDRSPSSYIDRTYYKGYLSEVDLDEHVATAVQHARDAICFPSPLLRIVCIDLLNHAESLLVIVAHHLLVDEHAFRLLIDELLLLYRQARTSMDVKLAPPTVPLAEFAEQSIAYWLMRQSEELAYWCQLPWPVYDAFNIKNIHHATHNIEAYTTRSVAAAHVGNEREFLACFYRQARLPMVDVLIHAIAAAYRDWTGATLNLAMVLHGRSGAEGIDISRTVAWISEAVPLVIDTSDNIGTYPTVSAQLARAHGRGRSYGVLRYLARDASVQYTMAQLPEPQLSLNVKLRSIISHPLLSDISILPFKPRIENRYDDTQRVFLLSAGAYFEQGHFYLSWDYSRRLFDSASVDAFTNLCMRRFIEEANLIGVTIRAVDELK